MRVWAVPPFSRNSFAAAGLSSCEIKLKFPSSPLLGAVVDSKHETLGSNPSEMPDSSAKWEQALYSLFGGDQAFNKHIKKSS